MIKEDSSLPQHYNDYTCLVSEGTGCCIAIMECCHPPGHIELSLWQYIYSHLCLQEIASICSKTLLLPLGVYFLISLVKGGSLDPLEELVGCSFSIFM